MGVGDTSELQCRVTAVRLGCGNDMRVQALRDRTSDDPLDRQIARFAGACTRMSFHIPKSSL
jgi:hypothetical protein